MILELAMGLCGIRVGILRGSGSAYDYGQVGDNTSNTAQETHINLYDSVELSRDYMLTNYFSKSFFQESIPNISIKWILVCARIGFFG